MDPATVLVVHHIVTIGTPVTALSHRRKRTNWHPLKVSSTLHLLKLLFVLRMAIEPRCYTQF